MPRAEAWATLSATLGLPESPEVGSHLTLSTGDGLGMAGTVLRSSPNSLALLLDDPAPGTAFLAAEGMGEGCGVSVWSYLYGPDAATIVERDKPRWQAWLSAHAGSSAPG